MRHLRIIFSVLFLLAGLHLFAASNDGKAIKIAASDATVAEKQEATLFCTGKNDEAVIQKAIDMLAESGGGKVLLSNGHFYIDAFPHESSIDHAAIVIPNDKSVEIRIEGDMSSYGPSCGTYLWVRDEVYEALDSDTQYTILRAEEVNRTIESRLSVKLRDLTISIPWNQKKICGIDMMWVNRAFLQGIRCNGYRSGYRGGWKTALTVAPAVAVEGSFGIRSSGGSNNACFDNYYNIVTSGFYEGFKLAGEHLVGINLCAVFCVYGYTFGNFPWTCGSNHPITLINCCDERNVNLPLFVANGEWKVQEKYGYSGQQAITFIDFNIERIAAYTPGGKLGDCAREVHPGTFRGTVEYTIQDVYSGHGNSVDKPFWEHGSGHNMVTRNQAQALSCDTKTRLTYAPNYLQHVWDTDLQKDVVCIDTENKVWVDALGNKVD